jgi:hypothetical protein
MGRETGAGLPLLFGAGRATFRRAMNLPSICAAAAALGLAAVTAGAAEPAPLLRVAAADLSRLHPADFADDEIDLPYFLAHLPEVANAVVSTGEHRGFIDIPVWRAAGVNRPWNARIMESTLSLAYFYCTDRPWNIYRGDPALRARLEAALDYWCRLQSEDGRFSEYGAGEWNLAATAFATKFMGRTLTWLAGGPPVDAALLARVTAADRKAILAVLTRDDLYEHGLRFSNQYENVWPGALAYLKLHPDAELEALMRRQFAKAHADFQSPAGYFYEADGPDWSYNLGTEQTNLEAARQLVRDPEMRAALLAGDRRFFEWVAYNAVAEPDGSGFFLNRAVETRQKVAFLDREPRGLFSRVAPDAEAIAWARPFCASREELAQRRRDARAALERDWPKVPPLTSFTPYDFFARGFVRFLPTTAERRAAEATLPYLARDRFIHQRADRRHPIVYTFVRRPGYYAAFNAGEKVTDQQRYGLGLVWSPTMGAVLQSQTAARDEAWGTRPAGAERVVEAATFQATFAIDGKAAAVRPGAFDLADGTLSVEYALGDDGRKTVTFADDAIRVRVQYAGRFTENLPLLVREADAPRLTDGRADLGRLHVVYDAAARARRLPPQPPVHGKAVCVLQLEAADRLEYALQFDR